MTFTFFDMAGTVLFTRDDAERANWTQEEMTLDLEFPYVDGKACNTGQRIFFIDPSTKTHQVYEIKQVRNLEPDHYQQVTAENIAISELTDEFTDSKEFLNKKLSEVLSSVLSGTLWTVGTVEVNGTSSVEISRGTKWQAILEIRDNWNVYIEPAVTVSASGEITRKLNVYSTTSAFDGIRLSINKNLYDPSVIIDDSEVATALYGFGGTQPATQKGEKKKEINFADVVWSKTSSHPAKPKGQKYLEDPDATALYGRNGRARFAYYQNNDIMDANVLLQKTWETLKTVSTPSVSIEGTVADLYRMGYADQPLTLHGLALVEVNPLGFVKQAHIIRMTTDLLDPSQTTLTIGTYIPNIIYIDKRSTEYVTGTKGGGGGGGGGGNKSKESQKKEFERTLTTTETSIGLRAWQNDLDHAENEIAKQEGLIDVAYDQIRIEVHDRRDADNILSAKINVERDKITQIVTAVGSDGKVTAASIITSVNNGSSNIKLTADHIDIEGVVRKLGAFQINALGVTANAGEFQALTAGRITFDGHTVYGWKSTEIRHATNFSTQKAFCYGSSSGVSGTITGYIALDYTTTTIHYLGY